MNNDQYFSVKKIAIVSLVILLALTGVALAVGFGLYTTPSTTPTTTAPTTTSTPIFHCKYIKLTSNY